MEGVLRFIQEGGSDPDHAQRVLTAWKDAANRRSWDRRLAVGAAAGTLCVLWVSALYYGKPELVSDLVKVLGGLAGGLLGGYGLGAGASRLKNAGAGPRR